MTFRTRALTLTSIVISLATAGCDTGSRTPRSQGAAAAVTSAASAAASSSSSGAASSSGALPGGNALSGPLLTLAPAAAAPAAIQSSRADELVALSFTLQATQQDVSLAQLQVSSSGSADERLLGEARWIDDLNANGLVDAGEPILARAPAATRDDAPYTLVPSAPLVLPAGSAGHYLLALDASALAQPARLALVGRTLELALSSAADLSASVSGAAVSAAGSFPLAGAVTLEFGSHVLISEVVVGPGSGATSAEYVELYNPTAQPVALETYYLTDFTDDPTRGRFHWKLPTGDEFGPAGSDPSSDFLVRFPAGARLGPGELITVALDGVGFQAAYAQDATYCLRNPGRTASIGMLSWDGAVGSVNFTGAPIHANAGLTNGGEFVCLFAWDGTSDLIQDVDLLNYGSASATNTAVNKSPNQTAPGAPDVRVDSAFDADQTASTYQDESSDLFQYDHRAPARPGEVSLTRVDFSEGQERRSGGNGLGGQDETSEDFGDGVGGAGTFDSFPTATPGRLP